MEKRVASSAIDCRSYRAFEVYVAGFTDGVLGDANRGHLPEAAQGL